MTTTTGLSFAYETYVRATADQVWRAITDGDLTSQYYFGARVQSTWTAGAPYAYLAADGVTHLSDGTVLEVEAPHRLVYDGRLLYDPEVAKDAPILLTWEVQPMGDVCLVRLTHDRFEGETATYRAVVSGVPVLMSSMKSLLETGQALPMEG
jgi:uncharacterized protein YndB with AHSA1/START domain